MSEQKSLEEMLDAIAHFSNSGKMGCLEAAVDAYERVMATKNKDFLIIELVFSLKALLEGFKEDFMGNREAYFKSVALPKSIEILKKVYKE